jgi:hypothetical protein
VIGPTINMTNKWSTVRITMIENRKTPNVAESVFSVPNDAGIYIFAFIKPYDNLLSFYFYLLPYEILSM